MKRKRQTPAEYAEQTVRIASVLGDRDERLAFEKRMAEISGATVESLRRIVNGDYHRRFASRGERWSDTYNLHRYEEYLAQHRAAIEALS